MLFCVLIVAIDFMPSLPCEENVKVLHIVSAIGDSFNLKSTLPFSV